MDVAMFLDKTFRGVVRVWFFFFFLYSMMATQLVTKITFHMFEAEHLLRLAAGDILRKASSQPQSLNGCGGDCSRACGGNL